MNEKPTTAEASMLVPGSWGEENEWTYERNLLVKAGAYQCLRSFSFFEGTADDCIQGTLTSSLSSMFEALIC